jgi:hypothetical protein
MTFVPDPNYFQKGDKVVLKRDWYSYHYKGTFTKGSVFIVVENDDPITMYRYFEFGLKCRLVEDADKNVAKVLDHVPMKYLERFEG